MFVYPPNMNNSLIFGENGLKLLEEKIGEKIGGYNYLISGIDIRECDNFDELTDYDSGIDDEKTVIFSGYNEEDGIRRYERITLIFICTPDYGESALTVEKCLSQISVSNMFDNFQCMKINRAKMFKCNNENRMIIIEFVAQNIFEWIDEKLKNIGEKMRNFKEDLISYERIVNMDIKKTLKFNSNLCYIYNRQNHPALTSKLSEEEITKDYYELVSSLFWKTLRKVYIRVIGAFEMGEENMNEKEQSLLNILGEFILKENELNNSWVRAFDEIQEYRDDVSFDERDTNNKTTYKERIEIINEKLHDGIENLRCQFMVIFNEMKEKMG